MNNKKQARCLVYDLEISPRLGWAYDMWETNILKIERPSHIMSLSWHWLGEKKRGKYVIHNIIQTDSMPRFLKDSTDDYDIVKKLHKLLEEAHIVIAHNASRFDNKVSNTMFLKHNMTPPSPFKTVDTLTVARSKFKFPRNSLGELGEFLGCGCKSEETHKELWYDCIMNNNKKAWEKMKIYNDRDVELLIKIYYKLLPYMTTHPNLSVISQNPDGCPRCGANASNLNYRGYRYTTTGTYRRLRCMECGGWCAERVQEKDFLKPEFVNI